MNEYDFRRIDREVEHKLLLLNHKRPNPTELVPIGEWDGTDIPGAIVDSDYIVWLEVPNPEYDCEVILD